jgi:two-component system response regulator GlrR
MNRLETKRNKILLVDDHLPILDLLSMRLGSVGYETMTAPSGEDAIAQLSVTRPDLMITDLRMDGMDGMALFEYVHERHPQLPVIILTAHGSIPEAVRATKRGVFGFLTKPFESEELLGQVADALRLTGDEGGNGSAATEEWCRDVLTRSPMMEELLTQAKLVAQGEANVLIQGENGTGKETLARAIHAASTRASGPFEALSCGAVTEALLESELFGHTKGSISGAATSSPGVLRAASGGTLFLDEVGEMPSALQVKLLRVLQEKRVRPLGSTEYVSVDVRVLSSTRRDLEQEVAAGAFREDLYYRLNVLRLDVPALTERREDIPLLANHFLREVAEAAGKPVRGFAPQAMEALMAASGTAGDVSDRLASGRPSSDGRGLGRDPAVQRCAARVRARLLRPDPQGDGRKREPRCGPGGAKPDGVLQAPAAPQAHPGGLPDDHELNERSPRAAGTRARASSSAIKTRVATEAASPARRPGGA